MQGGDDDPGGENALPGPDDPTPERGIPADPAPPVFDAPASPPASASEAPGAEPIAGPSAVATAPAPPTSPLLPESESKHTSAEMGASATPTRGAETWYRTDQDRFRSVRRRANPWYRRLARGVIAMAFIAAAGVGLFYGARAIQDYLDRDRLPDVGADVPEIRATTFEIRSTAPAPVLDGTLTLDGETKAFEFTGRGTGPQAGIQVVSPDGSRIYIRRDSGAWSTVTAGDDVVGNVQTAVAYLADADSADAILTTQLRRGYVDLIDRVEIGEGDDELRRYEMRLDTETFNEAYPLQYQAFEDRAIPGVDTVRGLLVTITLDDEDVLVAVDDAGTNWSWQRLAYTDQPFVPVDPAGDLLGSTIEITDGNVDG